MRLPIACTLIPAILAPALPAVSSDLYERHTDQRIDPARKPVPGKALVYVLLPLQKLQLLFEKVVVVLDGKPLGIMVRGSNGTFLAVDLDPGNHEFAAWDKKAQIVRGEFLADRTYFLNVLIRPGLMTVKAEIKVCTEASSFWTQSPTHLRFKKGDWTGIFSGITTTPAGRAWIDAEWPVILKAVEEARRTGDDVQELKPENGFGTVPWQE